MKIFNNYLFKIICCLFLVFVARQAVAQIPQQMNYQGAVRDAGGKAIANKEITIRLSILDDGPNSQVAYRETRKVTTNTAGLYSIAIGSAGAENPIGDFTQINWGTGAKYLKVEVDLEAGNNFTLAGVSPLLSVPYALYAKFAENGPVGPQGPQGPPGPQGEIGYTGGNGVPGAPGTPGIGDTVDMYVDNNTGIVYVRDPNDTNNWLPLTGAQGEAGPQGIPGVAGPAGAEGPAGPIGPQGPVGPQGEIGYTGGNGVPGAPGTPGIGDTVDMYVDNTTGIVYVRDPNNPNNWLPLTGAQGPIGPQGPTGPQGEIGYTGGNGVPGAPGTPGIGDTVDMYVDNNTGIVYVRDPNNPNNWLPLTGAQGEAGPQGPVGPEGLHVIGAYIDANGHLNLNMSNNNLIDAGLAIGPTGPQGNAGVAGPEGPQGVPGINGRTIWNGSGGPPPAGTGLQGDFYIDTTNSRLYGPKSSDATWGLIPFVSLIGPVGPAGPAGPIGPQGPEGPAGDSQLILGDGKVYVGDASSNAIAVSISGDATITNTGVITIADGAITPTKMAIGPPNMFYVTGPTGATGFGTINDIGWSLQGNSGTADGTHYLGTSDDQPLDFRIRDRKSGRITDEEKGETTFGYLAGEAGTGLLNNSLYGYRAGQGLIFTSNFNTLMGSSSGYRLTTASSRNTALGESSLSWLGTGNDNVGLGQAAGFNLSSGNHNVFLGRNSGLGTSGAGNNLVLIGDNALASAGITNAAAIGANAAVTNSNSIVLGGTGANAVNVGIGTNSPAEKLDVSGGNIKITNGHFLSSTNNPPDISTLFPSNGVTGINYGAIATTDVKGQVIAVGSNNITGYSGLRVQFTTAYNTAPLVTITPANQQAADSEYYVICTANNFSIFFKNRTAGMNAAAFNYWVIE